MNEPTDPRWTRRRFVAAAGGAVAAVFAGACAEDGTAPPAFETRLTARPGAPSGSAAPGLTPLNLGSARDGLLHVPAGYRPDAPAPLFVALHGAAADGGSLTGFVPLTEARGVLLLLPDSRRRTWDAATGEFDVDIAFLDRALARTFDRVAVDPARIALGGFSDGASAALSYGLANGDLFSRVFAFSPGMLRTPTRVGKPGVLIAHGTEDAVLPIDVTSRTIAPRLEQDGYTVRYREFDGGHVVRIAHAEEALDWLVG
jgi:phospholipase/carboxylesterase